MKFNSNEIKNILPHKYPFLLVDKIIEGEPGKYAIGQKAVTVNEMHFMGHFPEHHVMPGVLITEALAQVGAIFLLTLPENQGKLVLFAGIEKMKFVKQVVPGDLITLQVKLTETKGIIGYADAVATVNDEVVASGILSFAIK